MNWIKANKILLILGFFLPFCVSMCSRTDFVNGNQEEVFTFPKHIETRRSLILAYAIHPTEQSLSGVGITYYLISGGKLELSILDFIPLALIFALIGFVFVFFKKRKLILYLSILNLGCLLAFAVLAVFDDATGILWGFPVTLIISIFDLILLIRNKNTYS